MARPLVARAGVSTLRPHRHDPGRCPAITAEPRDGELEEGERRLGKGEQEALEALVVERERGRLFTRDDRRGAHPRMKRAILADHAPAAERRDELVVAI